MPLNTSRIVVGATSVAAALVLALGGSVAAHADEQVGTASLQGIVAGYTAKAEDAVYVNVYDLSGGFVDAAAVERDGRFAFEHLPSGTVKLGLQFNARNLLQRETFGKNDAPSFYSSTGPTSSWSKASAVQLSDGSTTTVGLTAAAGVRVTGIVAGDWVNGPKLCITSVDTPPGDAFTNSCDGLAIVKKYQKGGKTKYGRILKVTFASSSLLPGKYRVWTATLGETDKTYYWTGSKKKVTTKPTKAKAITVTKTSGTVSIGTFDATKR